MRGSEDSSHDHLRRQSKRVNIKDLLAQCMLRLGSRLLHKTALVFNTASNTNAFYSDPFCLPKAFYAICPCGFFSKMLIKRESRGLHKSRKVS